MKYVAFDTTNLCKVLRKIIILEVDMLFNIYYLNFSKVYEIKMMLSNVIKTDETIEKNQENTVDAGLEAKIGIKGFGLLRQC